MSTLLLKLTSNASLRGMISPDGMQVFSVYDFICIAAQKATSSNYGRVTYSRLISDGSEFKDEVATMCYNYHFPGGRGAATPTMTIRGLQRLLMILGSKVASEFRVMVESTFTRVVAGDTSLIEVIQANAASDAPLNQAFRQALAQEPIVPALSEMERKRKADREQALFDMEMSERQVALSERLAKLKDAETERKTRFKEAEISCFNMFSGAMDTLNPEWRKDARFRLKMEDSLKNIVRDDDVKAITNGEPLRSLSVGEVAQKMGFALSHGDSVAIGRSVGRAYLQKHGQKPPKHRQWVDGAEREVNSYTEADRGLIEAAVRERMGGDCSDGSE